MPDVKKNYDHLFKLLLVGDSDVGKTSILLRFSDDIFIMPGLSTIGMDFRIRTVTVGGGRVKLQLWDSAGQERFRTIISSYFRGSAAIIIVYDVTNVETFNNIAPVWLSRIDDATDGDTDNNACLKVLVGNKSDCDKNITTEEGQAFADENGMLFYETSAKENINIQMLFGEISARLVAMKTGKLQGEESGSTCTVPEPITPTISQEDPPSEITVEVTVPPEVLEEPFKHMETIGEGAFGDVFGYWDKTNNFKVAIKRIKAPISAARNDADELRQEVKTHEVLKHKNIVQYLGSSEHRNHIFIFLEWIDGGSLRDHLINTRLDPHRSSLDFNQIMSNSIQILGGLVYLHEHGVIHRDLRCMNILRTTSDILKIADFGIAKKLSKLSANSTATFSTTGIGNIFWNAPELFTDEHPKGKKVDIWSFGIVLLEMIYTIPPHLKSTEQCAYMYQVAVKRQLPEIPDFVAPALQAIIRLCLQYDPAARPTSLQLLAGTEIVTEDDSSVKVVLKCTENGTARSPNEPEQFHGNSEPIRSMILRRCRPKSFSSPARLGEVDEEGTASFSDSEVFQL